MQDSFTFTLESSEEQCQVTVEKPVKTNPISRYKAGNKPGNRILQGLLDKLTTDDIRKDPNPTTTLVKDRKDASNRIDTQPANHVFRNIHFQAGKRSYAVVTVEKGGRLCLKSSVYEGKLLEYIKYGLKESFDSGTMYNIRVKIKMKKRNESTDWKTIPSQDVTSELCSRIERDFDEWIERDFDEWIERDSDEWIERDSDEWIERDSAAEWMERDPDEWIERDSDEWIERDFDEWIERDSNEWIERDSDEWIERDSAAEWLERDPDEWIERDSDEWIERDSDECPQRSYGSLGFANMIPVVSTAVGVVLAFKRLKEGNPFRAAGELLSGLAANFPGAGTAISLGIDAALIVAERSPRLPLLRAIGIVKD